jgi:hypothetical protein
MVQSAVNYEEASFEILPGSVPNFHADEPVPAVADVSVAAASPAACATKPERRAGGLASESTLERTAGDCAEADGSLNSTSTGSGTSSPTASCDGAKVDTVSEDNREKGVALLVEFLTCILENTKRASEALQRGRPKRDEDPTVWAEARLEAEGRAEIHLQLLTLLFLETPLISHLFRMLQGRLVEPSHPLLQRAALAQFEGAALLELLLEEAANPKRGLHRQASQLFVLCLPHVEVLCTVLLQGAHGASASVSDGGRNAGKPIGALRVSVVHILAWLCDLAPELNSTDRVLALVSPEVWDALVCWFLQHRCNHIFQAACSRLLIKVAEQGSWQLQHLVFSQCGFVQGICDIVLARGQILHEIKTRPTGLQGGVGKENAVARRRRSHPGGLGSIVPVVAALVATAAEIAVEGEPAWEAVPDETPRHVERSRQPLGERPGAPTWQQQHHDSSQSELAICKLDVQPKATEREIMAPVADPGCEYGYDTAEMASSPSPASYLHWLLASTPSWTEVLVALGMQNCHGAENGYGCYSRPESEASGYILEH